MPMIFVQLKSKSDTNCINVTIPGGALVLKTPWSACPEYWVIEDPLGFSKSRVATVF